jgi:hypothetical protein
MGKDNLYMSNTAAIPTPRTAAWQRKAILFLDMLDTDQSASRSSTVPSVEMSSDHMQANHRHHAALLL